MKLFEQRSELNHISYNELPIWKRTLILWCYGQKERKSHWNFWLEIHLKENSMKVGFTVIIKDKASSRSGTTTDGSEPLY